MAHTSIRRSEYNQVYDRKHTTNLANREEDQSMAFGIRVGSSLVKLAIATYTSAVEVVPTIDGVSASCHKLLHYQRQYLTERSHKVVKLMHGNRLVSTLQRASVVWLAFWRATTR
jgi:histidinol phosphatase-like PHP family hydrolase